MSEENRNYVDTDAMDAAANGNREPMEEITIKFAKGLAGEPFMSRKGEELIRISIPNSDPQDHSPWQEFVLASKNVHENQYGKGLWAKIPADGHTTVSKPFLAGQDENGRNIWKREMRSVPNRELKEMVEYYKTRGRDERASAPKGREASHENAGADQEKDEPDPERGGAKAPPGKKATEKAAPAKRESVMDQLEAGRKEAAKEKEPRARSGKKKVKEPEL